MPTFGSLFAGIGGFDLGLERAGWRCAFQVEINPFCQRVLAERWPGVERRNDVRAYRRHLVPEGDAGARTDDSDGAGTIWHGPVDLLVGGFPCQDLSVAGKRAGLGGERSGLFYEIVRIARALRPTWGLFENVPGLLSSHGGRDMAAVLEGLRQCWPVVGYRILDSQHFGVAQRRRRVFLVGGPTEAGVAAVLALTESGERDLAARGEAGTRVAATLSAGSHRPGVNEPGRRNEDDVNLVLAMNLRGREEGARAEFSDKASLRAASGGSSRSYIAATLNSGGNSGGFRTEPGEHLVTHALTGEGHDAGEDGTERGTPLVAFNPSAGTRDVGAGPLSPPLKIGSTRSGSAGHMSAVASASAVRRLTPVECERLQGFPDGWTCLCQPLEAYASDPDRAAAACTCPDSPRYRALGNAVTVNVIAWLGRRLMEIA